MKPLDKQHSIITKMNYYQKYQKVSQSLQAVVNSYYQLLYFDFRHQTILTFLVLLPIHHIHFDYTMHFTHLS
jgi:hypothetical protein